MREIILQMLKETNNYISGQELCDRLSVSRTAVWKAINALKEDGYQIEAVRKVGYRLVACPDVLLSDEIKSLLTTKWWGRSILYYDTIDSTSNEVKRQAENGAVEGTLVIAEEQTAGRGRRGKAWASPPGTGIWMSFLLKPQMEPGQAAMITIVAALACMSAIEQETGVSAQIKWPNDIVINGRKTTGILTEMSTELTYINYVVVGIGINANTDSFPEDISATATSLKQEIGSKVERSRIVAAFGHYFEQYYEEFAAAGNLSGLKEMYEKHLVNIGRKVTIIEKDIKITRTALGIDDEGELLVQDDQGNITTVRAGEVSVRGIYGYV